MMGAKGESGRGSLVARARSFAGILPRTCVAQSGGCKVFLGLMPFIMVLTSDASSLIFGYIYTDVLG